MNPRSEFIERVQSLVEQRLPFAPSRDPRAEPGEILDTAALSGVLDLWESDLVVRVGAGTSVAALESFLASCGLSLDLDAPFPESSTLGGVFARGEGGRGAAINQSLRARVLGLRAVDGNARLLRAGARVVKNVAGYDLARMHYGAYGALGIVLDFTLRLSARPAARSCRAISCTREAIPSRLASLRRPIASVDPDRVNWLNAEAAQRVGAAAESVLLVERSGAPEVVVRWEEEVGGEAWPFLSATRDLWAGPGESTFQFRCPVPALVPFRFPRAALLLADLASGVHRVIVRDDTAPEWSAWGDASRRAQASLWAADPVDVSPSAVGEVADRLKAKFDPHGLLPPLPQPLASAEGAVG